VYSIAWRYGLDHRNLVTWNGLAEPYTIYPGQQLILSRPKKVPESNQVAQTAASDSTSRSSPKQGGVSGPTRTKSTTTADKVLTNWRWPTQGKLLNRFSYKDLSRRGIDIAGKIGQPVYAVADGKVVYSGNGLASYGNLIIVKHNNTYLSAYAFNRSALVKEGAVVRQGDVISEMGLNTDRKPVLHFQIRKNGKPVDPLRYLPKR
jgi:lipoprotein NlpD